MDRRQFLFQTSLATAGTLLPFKELLAAKPGNFKSLRRNVGYFTERGGTIGWLAAADALITVDAQFPKTAKHCLQGLQQRTDHAMNVFFNTHHHRDHTAGNPVFKPVAQKMVAHKNVPVLMKQVAEASKEPMKPAYPSTTFSKSWKAQVGDETIHTHYFGPAHTGGDAVVYFEKANVVHVGDLVFNRMNPYTDRPHGGSIHHWIKVLGDVMDTYPDDAIFIFGHGKPANGVTGSKEDLQVMQDYFSAMVDYVQEGVDQGKSREEILDKKKLDNFTDFLYADFWTLPKNLDVVYQEIKGKKWIKVNP